MNNDALFVKNFIVNNVCQNCDLYGDCGEAPCYTKQVFDVLSNMGNESPNSSEGCPICRDKRGNRKSLFIMTDSNKTIADDDVKFCPVCGRRM